MIGNKEVAVNEAETVSLISPEQWKCASTLAIHLPLVLNDLEHDSGKVFKMHLNAAIESGLEQTKTTIKIEKIPSTV